MPVCLQLKLVFSFFPHEAVSNWWKKLIMKDMLWKNGSSLKGICWITIDIISQLHNLLFERENGKKSHF